MNTPVSDKERAPSTANAISSPSRLLPGAPVARLNDCPLTASRYRLDPKSSSLTKTAAHYTLSRTML